ncbi:MAG: NUDIX hydrolase [Spirosomataceae bacterium]
MSYDSILSEISQHLHSPLPGAEAHQRMMSREKFVFTPKAEVIPRQSAVLVLLYPHKDTLYIPLIQRPKYDGVHGGQMALPGGKMENEDESLIRTALREAQEEIGIKTIDISILGTLSQLYIPPSNFYVQPVVGYMPYRPDFFPDSREVDDIIEVPAKQFLENTCIEERVMEIRGKSFRTPGYAINNHWIWGATASMLAEFCDVLQRISPSRL